MKNTMDSNQTDALHRKTFFHSAAHSDIKLNIKKLNEVKQSRQPSDHQAQIIQSQERIST